MADEVVPLPPDVWAVIAAFTRSKGDIVRIGLLCKASHDGVTKQAHPWRMLERKYGIQPAEEPERARENTIKYVKERQLVKHGLERFAFTGELRADRVLRSANANLYFWERVLAYVKSDPLFYHSCLTALFDKPDTAPTRELLCDVPEKPVDREPLVLQPPPAFRGANVLPERDMAMLCAVYTAVRKPGSNILLLHERDVDLWMRIEKFLEALDGDIVQGLPSPKWVVYSVNLDNSNNEAVVGTWIQLRNSSSIIVCSTEDPPPRGPEFAGIISSAIRVGRQNHWIIAPGFRPPEHCVHFVVPFRGRNIDELADLLF